MSFLDGFVQARLRSMYPNSTIQLERSPVGNYYDVCLTIAERDIVNLSAQSRDATARFLDKRLFPAIPPVRKHWSIRGRHAGK